MPYSYEKCCASNMNKIEEASEFFSLPIISNICWGHHFDFGLFHQSERK